MLEKKTKFCQMVLCNTVMKLADEKQSCLLKVLS